METPPLRITAHARRRYAERTSPHREHCTGPGCAVCRRVQDEIERLVAERTQDEEIERRVHAANCVREERRGDRDFVVLEEGGMWFFVGVTDDADTLVTCGPGEMWRSRRRTVWVDRPVNPHDGRAARVSRRRRLREFEG